MDAELICLGAEKVSVNPNPIADIQQSEDSEVELRHRVLPDVDLRARAPIGQLKEAGLPEGANGEDATCRPGLDLCRLELRRRLRAMFGDESTNWRGAIEALRVRIDAELFE